MFDRCVLTRLMRQIRAEIKTYRVVDPQEYGRQVTWELC